MLELGEASFGMFELAGGNVDFVFEFLNQELLKINRKSNFVTCSNHAKVFTIIMCASFFWKLKNVRKKCSTSPSVLWVKAITHQVGISLEWDDR